MKHSNGEIVDKALDQIIGHVEVAADLLDISVEMKDEKGKMHTYLVSFRRDGMEAWKAFDILEVTD